MEQFAPTFVAFDVAEDFCVPAALPSQSVIGEILLAENCGSIARRWFDQQATKDIVAEQFERGLLPTS
jgi:hypothetical protein